MRNKRSIILSWLIGATIIASSAIVPAPAQERLRIIVACKHLKDWRFRLCDDYGCVDKLVLCALGYHIIYGNKCIMNIRTPPSWEDRVHAVVPPCKGCGATNPSLYSLYAGSDWPNR